jgi:hypothetical protein
MSGLSIDGHVFSFAACQFGQKTAGSPLNSLVMSVARCFARLPQPVHIAAWGMMATFFYFSDFFRLFPKI